MSAYRRFARANVGTAAAAVATAYTCQLGFRLLRKASMPSRISADSQASARAVAVCGKFSAALCVLT